MERSEAKQSVRSEGTQPDDSSHVASHLVRLDYEKKTALEQKASSLIQSLEISNGALLVPKAPDALAALGTELIGVGEHAIVLLLRAEGEDAAIKILAAHSQKETNHHWLYRGLPIGVRPNTLWETVQSLRDAGVPVPYHHEMFVAHAGSRFACHVCPDLREGGRFRVYEAADVLSEGRESRLPALLCAPLREKLTEYVDRVVGLAESKEYVVHVDRHKLESSREAGIVRMFFVRESVATGALDLIAGDLDHMRIYHEGRNEAFLDWLLDGDAAGGVPLAASEISRSLIAKRLGAELL